MAARWASSSELQDREINPGFSPGAGEQHVGVIGSSARFGGDGADVGGATGMDAFGTEFECIQGAIDS